MATAPTDPKDRFLERNGFLRCTFDFEADEDCLGCNRIPGEGARQYYVRTCYEVDEGDYYCRRCAYDRATGRDYDLTARFRRNRPMHGGGWAYLHGMRDWETYFYRMFMA